MTALIVVIIIVVIGLIVFGAIRNTPEHKGKEGELHLMKGRRALPTAEALTGQKPCQRPPQLLSLGFNRKTESSLLPTLLF